MRAVVCRPGELGPTDIGRWREAFLRSGLANPVLAPEYAVILGDLFPESGRVAVVEDGNELVGFLPFTAYRLGRAAGLGGFLAGVQAFIPARSEWSFDEVLRAARLDFYDFTHLVAHQVPPGSSTSGEHALRTADLSGGYERYLERIRASGGRFVKNAEWRRRKLERVHPDVTFEYDSADASILGQLLEWKSQQVRALGQWDMYSELPGARAYAERVASARGDGMVGCASAMRIGERMIAGTIDVRFDGVQAGFLTAFDPAEARLSPGTVCILKLLEAAAGVGIREFHLGIHDQDFKVRLSTGAIDLVRWRAGRPGARARLAAHAVRLRGRVSAARARVPRA